MKYSTSSRTSAKWKSCTISTLSLYITLAVLLSPGNVLDQRWLLNGAGHQLERLLNGKLSVSDSNSLLAEAAAAAPATVASGETTASNGCTPLGEMIASRFNRAPQNNLRMLRGGGNRRAIESLIKTHNNCLLMSDRVRFKKSSPSSSNYKLRGQPGQLGQSRHSQFSGESSINRNEANKDAPPKNISRVVALLGWRRLASGDVANRVPLSDWVPSNGYTVKVPLRSSYKDDKAAETVATAESEESFL